MTDRPIGVVSRPVLRAMIDYARAKEYRSGVIGVRARPVWDPPATFDHHGVAVRVAPCVSALAVREAMLEQNRDGWLVIITDRPPDDLGDGLLSHFIGNRLRPPDEWEALRQRFRATGIDPTMQSTPEARHVAAGLLAAEPKDGWAPAPGGVLTLDHAMSAVFRQVLGADNANSSVDARTLLSWTGSRGRAGALAELRVMAGDPLVDAALDWFAGRLAVAGPPIRALLGAGRISDVIPMGLVADLLTQVDMSSAELQVAADARIRLEAALQNQRPSMQVLRAWADETRGIDLDDAALARTDELLAGLQASPLTLRSDQLPSALTGRLTALAERVRTAALTVIVGEGAALDLAMVAADQVFGVEQAWDVVLRHHSAASDPRITPFTAAIRLLRWLGRPVEPATSFADLITRHRDQDAWVDLAVNAAAAGSGDLGHAAALNSLLEVVGRRRDEHDRRFADALAATTGSAPSGVRYIEDVLARDVAPVLRRAPVLLLVLDGMAMSAAAEVVGDAVLHGWTEQFSGLGRSTAIAALPTLTEVSRASLLCGGLVVGAQDRERVGLEEFGRAHGSRAALFHKKPLDSSRLGFAVSDDVGAAIDDVEGVPLVTCVLNTIDDALDRSDPGGTSWTFDAIKHLQPLLERARTAGRVVILTADHGYVVERRLGTQRSYPDTSSNRSRAAVPPPAVGEVLVEGPRVLKHGGRAVLAVDERLRFGPLKAGYHGGATPAEAIVPVLYLVAAPSAQAVEAVLHEGGPQEPSWWHAPATTPEPPPTRPLSPVFPPSTGAQQVLPGFELESRSADLGTSGVANAVIASAVFAVQSRLAGRAQPSPDHVRSALSALLSAPGHRQSLSRLVAPLGGAGNPRGAFAALQRLLNVEGYPVVDLDSDGDTVVLDVDLLTEQFGVPR